MFGTFLILAQPRFFGTQGEVAYEYLIFYTDMLHNMVLVKTYGVDKTIFS